MNPVFFEDFEILDAPQNTSPSFSRENCNSYTRMEDTPLGLNENDIDSLYCQPPCHLQQTNKILIERSERIDCDSPVQQKNMLSDENVGRLQSCLTNLITYLEVDSQLTMREMEEQQLDSQILSVLQKDYNLKINTQLFKNPNLQAQLENKFLTFKGKMNDERKAKLASELQLIIDQEERKQLLNGDLVFWPEFSSASKKAETKQLGSNSSEEIGGYGLNNESFEAVIQEKPKPSEKLKDKHTRLQLAHSFLSRKYSEERANQKKLMNLWSLAFKTGTLTEQDRRDLSVQVKRISKNHRKDQQNMLVPIENLDLESEGIFSSQPTSQSSVQFNHFSSI